MDEQHPQFSSQFSGTTNPRRHRMRWLLTTLLLCALLVATVVLVVSLFRSIFNPRSLRHDATAASSAVPETVAGETSDKPADSAEDGDAAEDADKSTDSDEPEEPAEPEPVHARLLMIGDLLMHDGVIYSGQREDGSFNYDHLFTHIVDDVRAADVAVLNQETILGGTAFPYTGYPQFNSPQELGDAEVAAGFDVILKATNHTLDMGYDGVRVELEYWKNNHPEVAIIGMADPDGDGVCPAGTRNTAGPYIFEKDGLRIAMLNYTNIWNLNIDVSHDGQVVADMSEEALYADIAAAHEQADLVVVFPHWGAEYETSPSEGERYWASVMQDAGADVVIGGHPHVIQPVEVWGEGDDRMLIIWSVGNYVSNMWEAYKVVGGMATVDFVKDDDGARVEAYEFMPVICQRMPNSPELTAYKLPDYTDELAAASSIRETDPASGYSKQWYIDFCAEVLGEAFDRDTLSVHGELS